MQVVVSSISETLTKFTCSHQVDDLIRRPFTNSARHYSFVYDHHPEHKQQLIHNSFKQNEKHSSNEDNSIISSSS